MNPRGPPRFRHLSIVFKLFYFLFVYYLIFFYGTEQDLQKYNYSFINIPPSPPKKILESNSSIFQFMIYFFNFHYLIFENGGKQKQKGDMIVVFV